MRVEKTPGGGIGNAPGIATTVAARVPEGEAVLPADSVAPKVEPVRMADSVAPKAVRVRKVASAVPWAEGPVPAATMIAAVRAGMAATAGRRASRCRA